MVELIIYTGLLAVILLVSYQLFIQASYQRFNNKIEDQIYQSSQRIIFDLNREVKNAVTIDQPAQGTNGPSLILNSNGIIYSLNGNGRLQKNDQGEIFLLSGKGITLENLNFTVLGPSVLQKTVLVSFSIRGKQFDGKERVENIQNAVTNRK